MITRESYQGENLLVLTNSHYSLESGIKIWISDEKHLKDVNPRKHFSDVEMPTKDVYVTSKRIPSKAVTETKAKTLKLD